MVHNQSHGAGASSASAADVMGSSLNAAIASASYGDDLVLFDAVSLRKAFLFWPVLRLE